MLQPIAYLAFDGDCAQAMGFYAETLGGKLAIITFREAPNAAQTPPKHHDRVMHARLELPGGASLYGGDAPPQMTYQGIHGVSLALNYDTVEEAQTVFTRLSQGGKVTMPSGDTFWAKKFGMVTDRFGSHWIVNAGLVDAPPGG